MIGINKIRAIPPRVFEIKIVCPLRTKLDYNPENRSHRTFAKSLTPRPVPFAASFRLRRAIIGMSLLDNMSLWLTTAITSCVMSSTSID